MNITESLGLLAGIKARRSCRAYLKKPIPPEILRSVFEYAQNAPSGKNGQPWEVYVLTGAKLDALREKGVEALRARHIAPMNNDRDAEPVKARAAELTTGMGPFARKQGWNFGSIIMHSLRFFDAPAAAIICADKPIMAFNTLDLGSFAQTLCLSALGHGLGTCVLGYPLIVEPAIREFLALPDDRAILLTVALGYPDPDAPINQFKSTRSPIEENIHFLGE